MLGQHDLKPGQATELRVVYNTYRFPGKFEKYVYLDLGGEPPERLTITLLGEVEPIPMGVLEVNPRKLDAGGMPLGAPVSLELTIKNTGDADLAIHGVFWQKQETRPFDEKRDGRLVIPAGQGKTLAVQAVASQKGRFMDYLMIHSDGRNVTEAGYKVVVVGQCD